MPKFITNLFFLFSILSLNAQTNIDRLIQKGLPETIEEHRELVSIPNDAQFPEDMPKNVAWLEKAFQKRDFQTEVLEAGKVPIFFAKKVIDENKPTVLFYMHYDGQPVAPAKWEQADPFQPVLKKQNEDGSFSIIDYEMINEKFDPNWRVFARSAADDKGPIIMFLEALDIMKATNTPLAFNVKILLDGEEEKGSAGLKSTMEQYKRRYAADRLIIMDGPAHPTNTPTLMFGCRGIASATLTVYGARVPQHSGHFGNYAPNPVFRLSQLLASMKDEEGRVIIKGFYDGIELDENTRQILANVPDDEKAIQKRLGVAAPEKVGDNYQEALQYPSLNAKGIAAGWVGRQTRTIVPEHAVVQLGIRLVPESDGDRLLGLVKKHIESKGYYVVDKEPTEEERLTHPKIAFFTGKKSVNAFRTPLDSPTGEWLSSALKKAHGKDSVRIRIMGGTVPVTPLIEALGVPAVIVPMVNMDNNQHSPNENLRLGNLVDGIKTCVGILSESF